MTSDGSFSFFLSVTATTEIYTLSLHDALPISSGTTTSTRLVSSSSTTLVTSAGASALTMKVAGSPLHGMMSMRSPRSEEHTSELQSQSNLVCRLLLEKKKVENDSCGLSFYGFL